MASSKEFVQYVCDQMSAAAPVTYKFKFISIKNRI